MAHARALDAHRPGPSTSASACSRVGSATKDGQRSGTRSSARETHADRCRSPSTIEEESADAQRNGAFIHLAILRQQAFLS
mmetsp:Transcript_21236/g.46179  ORF Transcript_21236/g.46179 Transcript_21236/m.46179 type:complete len:81 (+) Transcript_21236:1529-1771(+)